MAHRRAVMTLYRKSLIHARSWAINTVRLKRTFSYAAHLITADVIVCVGVCRCVV
jgi:hypothetical protein